MEKNDYDLLLSQYRSIWNHRLLVGERSSEEIIKEAITRELKDENSHPRVRKSIYEKYFLSTQRLHNSSINKEGKLELLGLHIDIMKKLMIE